MPKFIEDNGDRDLIRHCFSVIWIKNNENNDKKYNENKYIYIYYICIARWVSQPRKKKSFLDTVAFELLKYFHFYIVNR